MSSLPATQDNAPSTETSRPENPRLHRIDVHHHIFPASANKDALGAKVGWKYPPGNVPWTPEVSLKAMDELGVQTAVLSFPAGLPAGPIGPENRAAARVFNQYAHEICTKYPERFAFFACVPSLLDPQGALEEIAFGLDELGACGIGLSSSYGEGADAKYIGEDAFDPVWEELDRREAVVFLHGAQIPSSTPFPHPFLGLPITEVPNETFKAAAHLVVTGKKRRYARTKIILAHLGGSAPFLAPRVAALAHFMGAPLAPEELLADFRTFFFDTALSSHAATLALMERFVPADRILFGTDFPAVSTEVIQWYTKHAESFYGDDQDRLEQVMCNNAKRLLNLP